MSTLHDVKDINRGAQRLYDICKAFLDTAVLLSTADRASPSIRERQDGTLVFKPPVDGFGQLDAAQFAWDEDMSNLEMTDDEVSALLGSLLGTQRPVTDMLEMYSMPQ